MNIDAKALKGQMAGHMQEVAELLLPNGQLTGQQWLCGDSHGKAGESLKLEMYGDKAGLWNDFATAEGGDILDLWQSARDVNFKTSLAEASQFLEDPNSLDTNVQIIGKKKEMDIHKNKNTPKALMRSEPTHTWYYRNGADEIIGKVVLFICTEF